MEIEIGKPGEENYVGKGKITFELFSKDLPKTTENFRALCTGEKGGNLHYKNTKFHEVYIASMAKGGDITNQDGTGNISIYGETFEDELVFYPHSHVGVLSCENHGYDTNSSKFNILF